MKTEVRDVLGFGEQSFKVPMLVYESVQEADKDAGKDGAMLAEANNNLLYRGTYADARELIVDVVQELTKVPFLMTDSGEKDEKGTPIMERDTDRDSDAKYVKRALTATPSVTFDAVQKLVEQRAKGYATPTGEKVEALRADIRRRVAGPRKPAKLAQKYRDYASGIVKAKNVAKFNKASSAFGIAAFVPTGDAEKDLVALGWLCKAYADAKAAAAAQEFAA